MPQISSCARRTPHHAHTWRETGGKRRTYSCPGLLGDPADATIRLRNGAMSPAQMHSYGWPSLRQAAHACGVSHSQLSRVINGQVAPGERLIAALLVGTGRTFEALFEVDSISHADEPLPLVGGHT
jgi:hypothetical protein